MDALVNDRGRVVTVEARGIDYRTMSACYESRWMRRALEEYRDTDVDGDEQGNDAGHMAEMAASLEQRVAALEKENRALREAV